MRRKSFVLLGHPVRHSASAPMLTAAFRAAGHPHTYAPIDVDGPDHLARCVRRVRDGFYDGANVTSPYKRAVLKLVEEIDPSAEVIGAANVLGLNDAGKLVGYNTDLSALEEEIAAATSARSRAAILGAGGGAMAAIRACKNLGFAIIGVTTQSWRDTEATFMNETASRARTLGALTAVWPTAAQPSSTSSHLSTAMRLQWAELAEQADIVIQATTAGMMGGPPGEAIAALVPFEKMKKTSVAFDLIYRPTRTPFLAKAEAAGLVAISGLGMLIRQAEAAYRLWTREAPPEGVMRKAAEVVLAAAPVA